MALSKPKEISNENIKINKYQHMIVQSLKKSSFLLSWLNISKKHPTLYFSGCPYVFLLLFIGLMRQHQR